MLNSLRLCHNYTHHRPSPHFRAVRVFVRASNGPVGFSHWDHKWLGTISTIDPQLKSLVSWVVSHFDAESVKQELRPSSTCYMCDVCAVASCLPHVDPCLPSCSSVALVLLLSLPWQIAAGLLKLEGFIEGHRCTNGGHDITDAKKPVAHQQSNANLHNRGEIFAAGVPLQTESHEDPGAGAPKCVPSTSAVGARPAPCRSFSKDAKCPVCCFLSTGPLFWDVSPI